MTQTEEMRRMWGWFLALGVLWMILGLVALGMSVFVTVLAVEFLGFILLMGGVFQVVHAFSTRLWEGFGLHLLTGLLYLLAGILVIARPLPAALGLTLVLAAFYVVSGIARIVLAVRLRRSPRGTGLLLNGVLNLVLGIFIWLQWPQSGLFIIGLFIAIDMIFGGLALATFALALRSHTVSGEGQAP